ncbi:hypothetical protein, partial [Paenibacillus cineris]|uniref:hypothetical protein n=1 Tax=Paenibacillus cineris TaxID=237530 RepID=UPI001BB3530F
NSPRKFVAHFESDEIDLISIAPVIRPSRLYSLVVQFSKIKTSLSAPLLYLSSNSYNISCYPAIRQALFLISFFFRFLPARQACTFSKGARINLPQNATTRQLPH